MIPLCANGPTRKAGWHQSESEAELTSPGSMTPTSPLVRRNDPYQAALGSPLHAKTLSAKYPEESGSELSMDTSHPDSSVLYWPIAHNEQEAHLNRPIALRGSGPTATSFPSLAPQERRSKRPRGGRQSGRLPRSDCPHGNSTLATDLETTGSKWLDTQALLRGRSICQHLQYPPSFPVSEADLERQIAFLKEIPPHLLESVLCHTNLTGSQTDPMPVVGRSQLPRPMAHCYLGTYLPFLPYPSFVDEGAPTLPASYPPLDPSSSASVLFIPTLEELLAGMGRNYPLLQPVDFFNAKSEPNLRSSTPAELQCKFHRRLFVGNLKKDLPLRFLQWVLDLISTRSPSTNQTEFSPSYLYDASIHRHASNTIFKGCIHVTLAVNEEPEIHRHLLHRRLLFDHSGVWFATSQSEERLLLAYSLAVSRLPEASPCRVPIGNLPRSPMSWEESGNRDTARCTRRAETQEAFVTQLLESRNGVAQ